ncbi:MAG: hypothetical protein KF708_01115 [Pirellulales bacterium]|nr:hypothetical protein [Pirellulales bacterium]
MLRFPLAACLIGRRPVPARRTRLVEINRNQYFLIGLVLLFLGIQFRLVDSVVLTPDFSRFLSQRFGQKATNPVAFLPAAGPAVAKTVRPPEWLGYSLMSIGSVLILHSLAMKRPGAT